MFRKLLLLFVTVFSFMFGHAQADSSHLRVSLLTCGTGDEIWQTFGHTAIRVTDSINRTDNVYNYGTFNGFDESFELNFMRGKLLYYLSYYPYSHFEEEYTREHRSVEEQVLLLEGSRKQEIFEFLKENAKEENRYYKYDFFFDNCATRIRDVFPASLGQGFKFGQTIPSDSRVTFRNIINIYFYRTHWERFGINMLLGSRIDKVMNNKDIMFLPDYLREGIKGATLNGNKIATAPELLVAGAAPKPAGVNQPLLLTLGIALLTIVGLCVPKLRPLGNIMQFIVLFVTGLLGCLIIVMWFGTDHQGCQNNFNILWALPTNLFLAAMPKRRKGKYALLGIGLIVVALALHLFRVQEMPLLELGPILLSLLFIYGTIYKRDK